MDKRTMLAVLLTMTIWITWFTFFDQQPPIQTDQNKTVQEPQKIAGDKQIPEVKSEQPVVISKKLTGINKNIAEEKVNLKTGQFAFELSNKGACISKVNYLSRNIDLTLNENLFNSNGHLDFSVHFSENEFFQGNSLNQDLWNIERIDDKTIKFFTEIMFEGNSLRLEKIFRNY